MRSSPARICDDQIHEGDWETVMKAKFPEEVKSFLELLQAKDNSAIPPKISTTTSPLSEVFRTRCRKQSLRFSLRAVDKRLPPNQRPYKLVKVRPGI
jgi:hypothetical protein